MTDSYIDVSLVYDRVSESIFQQILNILEINDVDYFEKSSDLAKLRGDLIGCLLNIRSEYEHRLVYGGNIITLTIYCNELCSEIGPRVFNKTIEVVSSIYEATLPKYVFGMHEWRMNNIESGGGTEEYQFPSPVSESGLENDRINHPSWLMLFPPEMVEEYGREWILNLPIERVEELGDGAILMVATEAFIGPDALDRPDLHVDPDTAVFQIIDNAMGPVEAAFDGVI
ncbi:hypothetical protein [Haloarchaeobius sp. TZWWS8]|uniref:hypothetical protein n=1 Tax=Haloarchaeobius sp. TZWWS8 TaxID=3446121 RepID=UPI003EBA8546